MAKFGGMGNMQSLMKQAQEMQAKLEEAQAELEDMEIEGSSGNGLITVTMNGKKKLSSIKIDPKAVDPDDVEMLEDLICAAFNEAIDLADEEYENLMGPISGGLKL